MHRNILSKEKWDASGANDVIARAGASLPQGTTEYLTVTSQQLFNREKLRSVAVCFGIGEERPFYIEKAPSLLLTRVQHNLVFFFMNYMILTAALFCLTIFIHPITLVGIGLLGALWVYMIRSTQNGPMLVYGKLR
jgi:PRA1 family protein